MFGSLILSKFLLSRESHAIPNLKTALLSDSQGNVFSVLNQKTRKIRTAVMLMELLLQLHRARLQLAPSHVKRDLNTWADELTYPNLLWFHTRKEVANILSDFTLLNAVLDGRSTVPDSAPSLHGPSSGCDGQVAAVFQAGDSGVSQVYTPALLDVLFQVAARIHTGAMGPEWIRAPCM